MKNISISVYYKNDTGYLIVPYAFLEKSVARVAISPVSIMKTITSPKELGAEVLKIIRISEEANPVDKSEIDKNVLAVASGIKSFPKFSKMYRSISIKKTDDGYQLQELIREQKYGSYMEDDSKEKIILSESTHLIPELGNAIYKLLKNETLIKNKEHIKLDLFCNENQNTIEYQPPSDCFINIDDGGSDALQIFRYGEKDNNGTYMGFFIVDQSLEVDENSIKHMWEGFYGTLKGYSFLKKKRGIFDFYAEVLTKDRTLYSYFIKKDIWIQLLLEMDESTLSIDQIGSIIREFDTTVESCVFK